MGTARSRDMSGAITAPTHPVCRIPLIAADEPEEKPAAA